MWVCRPQGLASAAAAGRFESVRYFPGSTASPRCLHHVPSPPVECVCAGRFEFLQYFPDSTQGAALAPAGGRGCLVAGVDAVRGFSRLDQVPCGGLNPER
jgi:hypothetical protein